MMRPLPQPSFGELTDALRIAVASDGLTIREMLRALWFLTRAIHPRDPSYWDSLPDFGAT